MGVEQSGRTASDAPLSRRAWLRRLAALCLAPLGRLAGGSSTLAGGASLSACEAAPTRENATDRDAAPPTQQPAGQASSGGNAGGGSDDSDNSESTEGMSGGPAATEGPSDPTGPVPTAASTDAGLGGAVGAPDGDAATPPTDSPDPQDADENPPLNENPGCELTETDIVGPFYLSNAPFRTRLVSDTEAGTPLEVRGRILARDCATPLPGAMLDVWQADATGDYDNSAEGYRLRGQLETASDGQYAYQTILPGRYLNGATYRPRHIHYKVRYALQGGALLEFTSQLYFEGDPFLEGDPWASPAKTTALQSVGEGLQASFDIILDVPPVNP